MKTLFATLLSTVVLASFGQNKNNFEGKIVYKYQFLDAAGSDITNSMSNMLGLEQHYFVNDKNYKAYDEKGNLIQLYRSDSNVYYAISKDRSAQKINASKSTSSIFTVKKTDAKEKIAGYNCKAIEVITDDATTTYYYSPAIKIDIKNYSKHNYGEWNKVLEATGGAIPLKSKMINHKHGFMTWISSAISITPEKFGEDNFNLPADIKVK